MPEATATPAPRLACGNCGEGMQGLKLAGHYGREVEIDLCAPCHLLWFDRIESARLGGPGVLALIGAMAEAQSLPHRTLRDDTHCPRCRGGLKTVHNRSRWGRTLQLECARHQHGAWQSFAQFLEEKGLVRPLSSIDRAALLRRDGRIDCVNCGAPVGAGDTECGHCKSVPSLFDVARLARALDPEEAIAPQAVHAATAERAALQCMACGSALGEASALQCGQCGATLAVSRLAEAHRQVSALGPALLAHARKPTPQAVRKRLDAQAGDLPRHREWLERMRAGDPHRADPADSDGLWMDWLGGARTSPLRAVFIALAIWFIWWYL